MTGPTDRQLQVLEHLLAGGRRGDPPTYRELAVALGLASTNSVADHIKALIRKGYVALVGRPRTSRRIRVTRAGRLVVREATAGSAT